MTSSRVPAVLDALIDAMGRETDARIADGPPTDDDLGQRDLIVFGVGYGGEDTESTADVTRTGPRGLRSHDMEQIRLRGVITCVRGAGSMKEARDRVASLFAVLEGLLTSDMTLGRVAHQLRIAGYRWSQVPTDDGIEAAVGFEIEGTAQL